MIAVITERKHLAAAFLITICTLVGVWIRLQPSVYLSTGPIPTVLFTDPWYTLRQIEVMLTHFPSQIWFDPMTNFPQGKPIDWGPLLPWIGSLLCILTGMTSPETMIPLVSWIPVICFVLVIPAAYYLGTVISDRKTGIITAVILTMLPGNFLIRTFYGNVDHHCLEILISTLFSLGYICTLQAAYQKNTRAMMLYGIMTGLLTAAGILNSVIILLILLITLIFSIIHSVLTFLSHKNGTEILKGNLLIFGTGLFGPLGLILIGLPDGEGYMVSPGEIALFLILVPLLSAGVWLLGILATKAGGNRQSSVVIYLTGFFCGIIVPVLLVPSVFHKAISLLTNFFLFPNEYVPVGEMQAWSIEHAFQTYNLLLLLSGIGICIAAYRWGKIRSPGAGYLCIWALMCLGATIPHVRYEYYLAVPLVLAGSLSIAKIFSLSLPSALEIATEEEGSDRPSHNSRPFTLIGLFLLGAILLMFGIFSVMLATTDYSPYTTSDDLIEGMIWISTHTPDPGIDYYQMYERQDPFPYPPETYGLLSWWESGHVMNFFSHRPIIADPFQSHALAASSFFLTPQETFAEKIADDTKARYVVTDSSMLFDNLAVMLQTYAPSQSVNDYYGYVTISDPVNNTTHNDIGFKEPFYTSMITRLHVFDGSAAAGRAPAISSEAGVPVPGTDMLVFFPGVGVDPSISPDINVPLESTVALQHYRLIWESNTSVSATDKHDIRRVKIFERVPGAMIAGDGTIEVPLITNRGRSFTYQQESQNGTFTLPYSTDYREGSVYATGPYRIIETGEEREVSEMDIYRQQG